MLGTLLGLPVYAVNWLVFRELLRFRANELHAGITHVVFVFFFSVVDRPLPTGRRGGNRYEPIVVQSRTAQLKSISFPGGSSGLVATRLTRNP